MSIDAMLEDNDTELLEVPIEQIKPDPEQDRTSWETEATIAHIESLAETIIVRGIDEPLKVRKVESQYIIIDGECRYRAALLTGLERCPVIVHKISAEQASSIMLSTQINKLALDPIELAKALDRRLELPEWDIKRLVRETGKSKSWFSKRLSLLKVRPEIQQLAIDNIVLDPVKLKDLDSLPDDERERLCKGLTDGTLPVSSILAAKTAKKAKKKAKKQPAAPEPETNQSKPETIELGVSEARHIFMKLHPEITVENDGDAFLAQWADFIGKINHG